MGQLSQGEIARLGFAAIGKNVMLSDKASYYNCANIRLGDNVRIDDFCVLAAGKGGIEIGCFVHIAVGSSLIGAGRITMSDFSGLSSRVAIYSSSDDYSGAFLTNPTVPSQFRNVHSADVFIGRHVIIGSGAVVLPGVRLEDGVAVGALSLITRDCAAFGIYAGNPARRVKERDRQLLTLEQQLLQSSSAKLC